MLETIKQYIKELPQEDFDTYYQTYILNVQDANIALEIGQPESITDISKLLTKIQRELGNIQ